MTHIMETKFKTIFASIPGSVRVVEPSEETRKEAKASLSQLKTLLPADIDPQEEPALLFVVANLAVAGIINLNDDGIDIDTGLAIYKKFEKQQINLEHDRKNVRGYIIHAGLSEFGTDRVITEDEARAANRPFNIAVVIALWKTVDKELCNYIMSASTPTHPDFKSLSLSFEIGFEDYRIIGLPLTAKEQSIEIASASVVIEPGDVGFERYEGKLRAQGGDGLSPDDANLHLYRIVDEGIIPLGGGIVTMPAAFVKGIAAVTTNPHEELTSPEAVDAANEEAEKARIAAEENAQALSETRQAFDSLISNLGEKIAASIISQETRVSLNTPKTINPSTMKQSDIQALKDQADKATTVAELKTAFASAIDLTTVITQESERREAARVEAEQQASKLEEAKKQAQAASEQLTKDLEALRTELNTIRAAQEQAAAEQKFQERMAAISEVFDVDADSASFFAEEVKACDSDESFAKKFEKFKKLMPEKTKDFKKKKADDAKASIEKYKTALKEKGVEAKFNEQSLEIEEIIASAQGNPIESPIVNVVQPVEGSDIKSLAKKAFAGITIGGKSLDTLKKKE